LLHTPRLLGIHELPADVGGASVRIGAYMLDSRRPEARFGVQDRPHSVRIAREGDTILVDVTGTDDGDDAGHEGDDDAEHDGDDDAEHEGDDDAEHDGDDAEHRDGDRDDTEHRRARGFVGEVQVRVPVSVVDALLSGAGESLDVRAAIQQLSALRGEMVQVIHPEGRVRVWIDESPTQ